MPNTTTSKAVDTIRRVLNYCKAKGGLGLDVHERLELAEQALADLSLLRSPSQGQQEPVAAKAIHGYVYSDDAVPSLIRNGALTFYNRLERGAERKATLLIADSIHESTPFPATHVPQAPRVLSEEKVERRVNDFNERTFDLWDDKDDHARYVMGYRRGLEEAAANNLLAPPDHVPEWARHALSTAHLTDRELKERGPQHQDEKKSALSDSDKRFAELAAKIKAAQGKSADHVPDTKEMVPVGYHMSREVEQYRPFRLEEGKKDGYYNKVVTAQGNIAMVIQSHPVAFDYGSEFGKAVVAALNGYSPNAAKNSAAPSSEDGV